LPRPTQIEQSNGVIEDRLAQHRNLEESRREREGLEKRRRPQDTQRSQFDSRNSQEAQRSQFDSRNPQEAQRSQFDSRSPQIVRDNALSQGSSRGGIAPSENSDRWERGKFPVNNSVPEGPPPLRYVVQLTPIKLVYNNND
jgi:hypothetical protein